MKNKYLFSIMLIYLIILCLIILFSSCSKYIYITQKAEIEIKNNRAFIKNRQLKEPVLKDTIIPIILIYKTKI